MRGWVWGAMAALLVAAAPAAQAQTSVAQFYKGRQVKLYIGSTPGGGYDSYGRLVARHIGEHIPGNPTIVPVNMAGAGSNRLAEYMYSVAPKDGSEIALVFPGAMLDPILTNKKLHDDPSKFNYLGSANIEDFLCLARSDAPVKTFADTMKTQVLMAASAAGGSTVDIPALTNNLIGTKFKVVSGYPGSREINLAIEQGEVQGACGLGWSSIETQHPDWITSGKIRILAQMTNRGLPALDAKGIPLAYSYAKNDQDRAVMELVFSQEVFGRPFIVPPGVPQDRVAALRKAFSATLADKTLLKEAKGERLDIAPISGEEVQALVTKVYAMSPSIIARAKEAIIYKPPS